MFDDLRDLYQQVILDHGRSPKHMRRLEPFDAAARGDNPMCGDRVEVRVRLDGDRVVTAAYEGRGCAISIASADLMAEAVEGQLVDEIRELSVAFREMVRSGDCGTCNAALTTLRPLSGVSEYPSRLKCATLPWDALMSALEKHDE